MRTDAGYVLPTDVLGNNQGCHRTDPPCRELLVESLPFDDALFSQEINRPVQVIGFIGEDQKLPGGGVVGQEPTLPIEYSTSRRRNWNSPQPVVLRLLGPRFPLDDLEVSQFEMEEAECAKNKGEYNSRPAAKKNGVGANPH